jgi:hypothetical protein
VGSIQEGGARSLMVRPGNLGSHRDPHAQELTVVQPSRSAAEGDLAAEHEYAGPRLPSSHRNSDHVAGHSRVRGALLRGTVARWWGCTACFYCQIAAATSSSQLPWVTDPEIFSIEVCLPAKVGTGLVYVKSITEQIQHTLNIAKVTAQQGSTSLAGSATPQSHHSTPYVVSLRWTHRMMTMTSRRWRWGSVRGSADQPLAHCAESAQPTYVRCPEGKPSCPRLLA